MENKWWDVEGHSRILVDLIKKEELKKIAEIGLYRTRNARFILRNCYEVISEYWGIDKFDVIWENTEKTYTWPKNTTEVWDRYYWESCRYMPFFPQFRVLKMDSENASKLFPKKYFPEGYFDFVYIDGDHSYEMVKKDIELWLPLVKKDGILGGHDYGFPAGAVKFNGVREAVDELLGRYNIKRFKKEGVWLYYKNRERYYEDIQTRIDIYRKDPTELYTKEFVSMRTGVKRKLGMKLGKSLVEFFNAKTFVDFGCCIGSYLEGALNSGAEKVLGFDIIIDKAQEYIPENMKQFLKVGNVGIPIECGKWDCVISLEVAEHILPEQTGIFIDNLVNAATKYILFSSSEEKGYYHFNTHPKFYWIDLFKNKGFSYSVILTEQLRRLWEQLGAEHFVSHNLMVFEKFQE